jgi:hypothetical protein
MRIEFGWVFLMRRWAALVRDFGGLTILAGARRDFVRYRGGGFDAAITGSFLMAGRKLDLFPLKRTHRAPCGETSCLMLIKVSIHGYVVNAAARIPLQSKLAMRLSVDRHESICSPPA